MEHSDAIFDPKREGWKEMLLCSLLRGHCEQAARPPQDWEGRGSDKDLAKLGQVPWPPL